MPRDKPSREFKSKSDFGGAEKKAERFMISLRKEKKAENLQRRRLAPTSLSTDALPSLLVGSEDGDKSAEDAFLHKAIVVMLQEMEKSEPMRNLEALGQATIVVRQLGARSKDPPLEEMVEFHAIEAAAMILHNCEVLAIQIDACWILLNIACGAHFLDEENHPKEGGASVDCQIVLVASFCLARKCIVGPFEYCWRSSFLRGFACE